MTDKDRVNPVDVLDAIDKFTADHFSISCLSDIVLLDYNLGASYIKQSLNVFIPKNQDEYLREMRMDDSEYEFERTQKELRSLTDFLKFLLTIPEETRNDAEILYHRVD